MRTRAVEQLLHAERVHEYQNRGAVGLVKVDCEPEAARPGLDIITYQNLVVSHELVGRYVYSSILVIASHHLSIKCLLRAVVILCRHLSRLRADIVQVFQTVQRRHLLALKQRQEALRHKVGGTHAYVGSAIYYVSADSLCVSRLRVYRLLHYLYAKRYLKALPGVRPQQTVEFAELYLTPYGIQTLVVYLLAVYRHYHGSTKTAYRELNIRDVGRKARSRN